MDKLKKVLRRDKDEKTEEDDIIEVTSWRYFPFSINLQINWKFN